jgi:hypothetical protein
MNSTQPSIALQAAWCRDALACQNACNITALTYSWNKQCEAMQGQGLSTNAICDHPATRLYSAKMADLAGLNYRWPIDAEAAANAIIRRDEEEQKLAIPADACARPEALS